MRVTLFPGSHDSSATGKPTQNDVVSELKGGMLCPMTVQWRFIGQSENRKSLKYGESAGIRTQDPRLKRASGLVPITNDQM